MTRFAPWWARLVLVMVIVTIVGFLPYPRLLEVQKYIPLNFLLLFITLIIFGIDLIREKPELNKLRWVKVSVSIAAMIALIASSLKGICELRTEWFDPIRQASGKGYIYFETLIGPTSFRPMNDEVPIEITRSITGRDRFVGRLSMSDIKRTTRYTNTNEHDPLEQASTISFRISSDPLMFENRLETVSAKTFTEACNYLEVILGVFPRDVSYDGEVWLTINGKRTYRFSMPKAYPSQVPAVFVPLNDRARVEMMNYKLYNPETGTKEHFIDESVPKK